MRKFLFLLLLAALVRAAALEDAAAALARTVTAQLAPGETAHVTARNVTPALASETARARDLLDRALRRPAARGAAAVEVVVTASANIQGPLLVVEIEHDPDPVVETAAYTAPVAPSVTRPALAARLLWEQDEPILDVVVTPDGLRVLSPSGVKLCKTSCEAQPGQPLAPARDWRGKFDPVIDGEPVRFTPGQNTLETAAGEKVYSLAHAGKWRVIAGLDGWVHATDGQQMLAWDGWGSDLASMPCGSSVVMLADGVGGPDVPDTVAAYEIAAPAPRTVTSPLSFPGPVTALWPAPGGALAVVRQLSTGRYAAYMLTLDCGR